MNLFGRFYFLLTASGNLFGEFSNNFEQINITESADRVDGDINSFVGTYISTWHEGDQTFIADLTINLLPGGTNVYTIEWLERNGDNFRFLGEALLARDMLIGNYADDPLR